jgi:hypothetical protein
MGEFLAKFLELVWKPVGEWIERRRRLRYWNEMAILMSRTTSTVDFDPAAREVLLKHVTDDRVIPANDADLLASLVEDGSVLSHMKITFGHRQVFPSEAAKGNPSNRATAINPSRNELRREPGTNDRSRHVVTKL